MPGSKRSRDPGRTTIKEGDSADEEKHPPIRSRLRAPSSKNGRRNRLKKETMSSAIYDGNPLSPTLTTLNSSSSSARDLPPRKRAKYEQGTTTTNTTTTTTTAATTTTTTHNRPSPSLPSPAPSHLPVRRTTEKLSHGFPGQPLVIYALNADSDTSDDIQIISPPPRRIIHGEVAEKVNQQTSNSTAMQQLEETDDLDMELKCPICLDEMKRPCSTPCGHNFCKGCLEEATRRKSECPVCRASYKCPGRGPQQNHLLTILIRRALETHDLQQRITPATPTRGLHCPSILPSRPLSVSQPKQTEGVLVDEFVQSSCFLTLSCLIHSWLQGMKVGDVCTFEQLFCTVAPSVNSVLAEGTETNNQASTSVDWIEVLFVADALLDSSYYPTLSQMCPSAISLSRELAGIRRLGPIFWRSKDLLVTALECQKNGDMIALCAYLSTRDHQSTKDTAARCEEDARIGFPLIQRALPTAFTFPPRPYSLREQMDSDCIGRIGETLIVKPTPPSPTPHDLASESLTPQVPTIHPITTINTIPTTSSATTTTTTITTTTTTALTGKTYTPSSAPENANSTAWSDTLSCISVWKQDSKLLMEQHLRKNILVLHRDTVRSPEKQTRGPLPRSTTQCDAENVADFPPSKYLDASLFNFEDFLEIPSDDECDWAN